MLIKQEKQLRDKISHLEEKIQLLEKNRIILERKARQADSASKAKSDFLAMVSHEIRTPMNGVIGLSELLLETKLESRQKQFAELILSSARNLLTLINSLLDFSKIEADKMTLDIKPFNLRELLDEIVPLYELAGKRKGVEVNLEVDPGLAECYLGDAYRIRQILVNLLGNGIKFTDRGSVQLSVVLEKKKDPGLIRFTITDSGPGIPEDKQDRLFVAFSQVDNSSTRQYSGTGLGLSICKKLVELMDGTLDFSSRVGQGSSFWFTLRLVRPETVETKLQPDNSVPVPPMTDNQDPGGGSNFPRILIVDDDETNRMVLEEIFRKTDALIVSAENGEQAVQFCRQLPFDLILMDCRMPVMDGFEATARIRKQLRTVGSTTMVIIALTADATMATEKKCRQVGMDGYLLKPLDTTQLQKVLDARLPDFNLAILPEHADSAGRNSLQNTEEAAVDHATLEELCRTIDNIKPVITIFLNLLPRRLKKLEKAVQKQDSTEIASIAHTLRGSCSQFGAYGLAELCSQAEDMARDHNLTVIKQQYDRIYRTAGEVSVILQEKLD